MINRNIFNLLVKKIGSEQGVYSAIRRKETVFKNSIKPDIACYLVATDKDIKISRYLEDSELSKVNKLLEISPLIRRPVIKKDEITIKEIKEINPYNLSLSIFNIDNELVKDCKLVKPYRGCIREALLTLETKIKNKLEINKSLTGRKVITECKRKGVFKRQDKSEEEGLYFLFCGAILWMRNPPSHKKLKYSKQEAIQVILFTDYLIKLFYKLCEENNIN